MLKTPWRFMPVWSKAFLVLEYWTWCHIRALEIIQSRRNRRIFLLNVLTLNTFPNESGKHHTFYYKASRIAKYISIPCWCLLIKNGRLIDLFCGCLMGENQRYCDSYYYFAQLSGIQTLWWHVLILPPWLLYMLVLWSQLDISTWASRVTHTPLPKLWIQFPETSKIWEV